MISTRKKQWVMMAWLYQFLVRLHPRAFREKFGWEMLCIFEEADEALRSGLFADCFLSLLRQWVLRSGRWIIAVAGLIAFAQVALPVTAWHAIIHGNFSAFLLHAQSGIAYFL